MEGVKEKSELEGRNRSHPKQRAEEKVETVEWQKVE